MVSCVVIHFGLCIVKSGMTLRSQLTLLLCATLYTNATGTHKDEHAQKPEQSTRVGAGPAPLPPLVAAADAADADARM